MKKLYKNDIEDLEIVLNAIERGDLEDAGSFDVLKRLLNDPTIPQDVIEIIYWNCVYEASYGTFHSGFTLPKYPEIVEWDKGKAKIHYDALTDYIIKLFIPLTYKKQIWVWNGEKWKENEGEIERTITYFLKKEGISDERKIRDTINEILARISWLTIVHEFPFNNLGTEFIPLKNGVLWRGHNYELLPNGPAFGYTFKLPVKYDPKAECPKIDKFISEVVDEENIPILYEIPALALMQNPWHQTAYMLVGSGSNGKSTYLKLIETFLGKENVSNISLQELCEDRFKAAELVGKLANIYADLPKNPIRYTGKFKMLTGGDRILVEKKYKDPFPIENKAVFVFSANELPQVNDQTYAFWRRWIIVEFPNTFEKNEGLIEELTTEEELSGFLNKVLLAMTRIEVKGVTRTKAVERIMEEWMKKANSVYAFVQDCIERDIHSYELKDTVYQYYLEYCEMNELNPLPKNKFSAEFQRLAKARSARKKIGGQRMYIWEGIRLKTSYFEEEETSEAEETFAEQEWDLTHFFGG